MILYEDSNTSVYRNNGSYLERFSITDGYSYYALRPVINLDKCCIDGGCTVDELKIINGCTETITEDNNLENNSKTLVESDKNNVN